MAKLKPYLKQYILLIAAGIIVISGFVHVSIVYRSQYSLADRIALQMPVDRELELEAGEYALFYEYEERERKYGPVTVTNSRKMSGLAERLEVTVTSVGDGEQSKASVTPDSSMSYKRNDVAGQSLYSFAVPRQDRYRIAVNWREEMTPHDEVRLTIMKDFTGGILSLFSIIGVYLLIAVPFVGAGLWIYHRTEKRKSASRAG